MLEVELYQLAYHPTHGCGYRFQTKGTAEWSPWYRVPAADLAAVAAVLNESPVFYDPKTGAISTGEEPPGR